MIEFDRIVAYGCSMTAADEALDHVFIDRLSERDMELTKLNSGGVWSADWYSEYLTPKYCSDKTMFVDNSWNFAEQVRRTREVSWVRWLADKFGVPYLNRAIGGAGIEYNIYCYEQDLSAGIIKKTDLVLFGLTTPHRWFWLDDNGNPKHPLLGHSYNWPSEKFYKEYLIYVGNDYQNYWDYYSSIKYIDMLSSCSNNQIKSLFVTVNYNNLLNFASNKDILNENFIKIIESISNMQSIIKMDYHFKSYELDQARKEPNPSYCGFGHPKISEHKIMAENLYKYIADE